MNDSPLTTARLLGREFARLVVVQPVRDGRLGVRSWTPALRWIGGFSLLGYVVATVLVVLAGPIRANSEFLTVGPETYGVSWTMPLFSILLTFSLVVVITASVHLHWFLTLCVLLITAQSFTHVAHFTQDRLYRWLSAGAFAALALLPLVRRGKRFHPAEFAVVAGCVLVGLQLPMLSARQALELGLDNRGLLQGSLLQLLGALAIPAIAVAGAALTQLAVTAGETAGALVRDNAPRWLLIGVVVALLGWRGWATIGDLVSVADTPFSSYLPGTLLMLITCLAGALVLALRARRVRRLHAPGPGDLTEIYAPLMYVIAAGAAWWVLLMGPFVQMRDYEIVPASHRLYPLVAWFAGSAGHPLGPTLVRFALGVAALWWGWRRAGRGDWLTGVLMACFFAPRLFVLIDRVGPDALDRSGWLDYTDLGVEFWLFAATVAVLGYLVAARRVTRHRLGAVAIALAIGALYPYRAVLADPISTVLGFSVVAVLLFGLVWRLLTDGQFLRADTAALPRETRILLFCANSVFAVTQLAFVSLARSGRAYFDLTAWESLGDAVLAQPLYVAGVIVALACAVAPSVFPSEVHDTTQIVGGRQHLAPSAAAPRGPSPSGRASQAPPATLRD